MRPRAAVARVTPATVRATNQPGGVNGAPKNSATTSGPIHAPAAAPPAPVTNARPTIVAAIRRSRGSSPARAARVSAGRTRESTPPNANTSGTRAAVMVMKNTEISAGPAPSGMSTSGPAASSVCEAAFAVVVATR